MRKINQLVYLVPLLFFTIGAGNAYSQLSAGFSSNRTQGCAPLVVQFLDASVGNPTSWRWDLGNGTISFLQNPAATYFNPGTYTVKLVVSRGGQSDSVTRVNYITVNASPELAFVASDSTGCFPLPVQFLDQSKAGDGSITNWLWDFGDGDTSNLQNPLHTYDALGNYNVSLQVRNSAGCIRTLTKTNYIRVNNGVIAGFDFTAPANCRPPTTVSFNNTSTGTGNLIYQWDFGDGTGSTQANPTHTYTVAGSYSVSLIIRNNTGCVDTISVPNAITIGTVDASFNAPSIVCAGAPVSIANTSMPLPAGALWRFGDGTVSTDINPVKTYATAGQFLIQLVSDFGACLDSTTKTIQVLEKPSAAFTASDTNACKPPLTVNFVQQGTGAINYKWFFGDGDSATIANATHTYSNFGIYTVTLISYNANGCTDTVQKLNHIKIQKPGVEITEVPQEGCVPYSYRPKFNILTPDSISSYQWDFGDGQTSSLADPVNVYTKAGTYTVRLIFTTTEGCVDTAIAVNAVKVGEKPIVQFEANPRNACAFQQIGFRDLSTGATADQWYWEFGDGGTSTDKDPSHTYQDTGYFTVKLTVWSNGCRDSLIIPNYIYIKPPIARFYDSSDCSKKFTRWFIDQSIGATSWRWDFGDGNSSTLQNPTHTYAAGGSFIVTLTVRNDTCEHTQSQQVLIVSEIPAFSASDTIVCKGETVTFSSPNSINNISQYNWIFTHSSSGIITYGPSSPQVNIQFFNSGYYDVSLIIVDRFACRDTITKRQYIRVDGPTAAFTNSAPTVCAQSEIIFTDSSYTDGIHAIRSWIWDYGDGNRDSLTTPPFRHIYLEAGSYTVQLTVVDEAGCRHTTQRDNYILISKPAPFFVSPDTLSCTGKTIRFFNHSTGNFPISYNWRFDNGQVSTLPQPTTIYNLEGDYRITLTATDRYGCIDSLSKPAYIKIRNPVSVFTISDSVATCPPLIVHFTNQSLNYTRYEWDFGDGTKSMLSNPVHFYTYPGTYTATLTVTSNGGCTQTSSRTLVVRGPQGTFTYDKNTGCEPTTIRFNSITSDTVSYVWDFDDGTIAETGDSVITHTYTRRGTFLPKMILVDPQGCRVPVLGKDTIRIFGVDAKFGISRQLICDSGMVNFYDSSISNDLIVQYAWTFGDGSTANSRNVSKFFNQSGQYPVQLITTTQTGCRDTSRSSIPITISASPVIGIEGNVGACIPAQTSFLGTVGNGDTSQLSWNWNFGNGITAVGQYPSPVNYTIAGNYQVSVVGRNNFGCTDTALSNFVAWPIPPVNAGADQVLCLANSTSLQATGAIEYKWTPSIGLSCTDCASPRASPSQSTVYHVSGKNINGCTARDSVLINVQQPFELRVSGNDTICVGETVQLFASGADLYTWTPASSLDNSQSDRPRARPSAHTLYQVTGRDKNGCFADTGQVQVLVYPYPFVKAGDDKTIASGGSVQLKAEISPDTREILWVPATGLSCSTCADPVAAPKQSTTYTVTVKNIGGCLARDEVSVFVFCNNSNIFVPNTFSPNGDGNNDVFYPRGRGLFIIKGLRIFNRWGELVFERTNFQANDQSGGWDGMHKGKPASQDVYVYTMEVLCENQTVLKYHGNVALIR